jgi:cyclopropane fatty-acyl-phospholipid synthase-like methyltransferase
VRPDEKTEEADGVTCRYSSDWIHHLESEDHWRLYHRQASVMQGRVRPGDAVLEIGVGSGFTANYLRSKGVLVTTVDIDADKRPDIVANIVTWDFGGVACDHILAFEVFEHIPYDRFEAALTRAASACRGYLFMSVPSNDKVWLRLQARVPRLKPLRLDLTTPRGSIPEGHHFWEVGYGPTTLARLDQSFEQAGFRRVHQEKFLSRFYFVLEKK